MRRLTPFSTTECIHADLVGPDGYGRVYSSGRQYQAHRFVYEAIFGKVDADLVVRHKCDNRRCVNIDHLEVGTRADNSRDMTSRNRQARGESLPQAKLTTEEARQIRCLSVIGVGYGWIASVYRISRPSITGIKKLETWKCAG